MWMIWGSLVSFCLLMIGLEYKLDFIINLVCFNMVCVAGIQLLSGMLLLFIQDEIKHSNLYTLRVLQVCESLPTLTVSRCLVAL